MRPQGISIHWPGWTRAQINAARGKQIVDNMRAHHVSPKSQGGNGWSDIGYHYVLSQEANGNWKAFDGRSDKIKGAHTFGFNDWIGINVAYAVDDKTLDPMMLEQLAKLIAAIAKEYNLPINSNLVKGHRQFEGHKSNQCPGNLLVNTLPSVIKRANEINNLPKIPVQKVVTAQKESEITDIIIKTDDNRGLKGLRINNQAFIHVAELEKLGIEYKYIPASQNNGSDMIVITTE